MTFNLAKKKKIPGRFRDQALYHQKLKDEDPKGDQAAQHLAFTMIGERCDIETAMAKQNAEYWEYVKDFDEDYFNGVLDKADDTKAELVEMFKNDPSSFPLPPKEQGGGGGGEMGGGAPPPMAPPGGAAAANKGRLVTAILPGGEVASTRDGVKIR